MSLLTQNKKIRGSNTSEYLVVNFGIPAYQTKSGFKTCPNAGKCAKGCYANQGAYRWSNVAQAYEKRFEASQSEAFGDLMQTELDLWIKRANKQNKILVVRIHDAGDFYNLEYLNRWIGIINKNHTVIFYAYTKMITLFKRFMIQGKIPSNFTVIFSYGSNTDQLINPNTDRHSQVFSSMDDLLAAGYVNTTEDDLQAVFSPNHKIGLVYHGAKSKAMVLKASA